MGEIVLLRRVPFSGLVEGLLSSPRDDAPTSDLFGCFSVPFPAVPSASRSVSLWSGACLECYFPCPPLVIPDRSWEGEELASP